MRPVSLSGIPPQWETGVSRHEIAPRFRFVFWRCGRPGDRREWTLSITHLRRWDSLRDRKMPSTRWSTSSEVL